MRLRSLDTRRSPLVLGLGKQRLPEQGQCAEALDAPEPRLDVEQGRGQPPLLLVGGAPAIDFGHPLLHEAIERLQAVRRLQTDPELAEEAEPVQGERLLQPFADSAISV